jgi:hypothetical protein
MKRKVLLLFVMFMCAVGTWAYNYPGNSASQVKDYGEGKTVCFYDEGSDVQRLVVGAGGLAEWLNDASANQASMTQTSRTKLVITGTLNADDVAAIKTYFIKFTTVDMEGVTLEEGASVNGMHLPNAEYIALPHGTPIADMKALNSTCPKLKAVAATDAASPTAFTGYSWAAGEIWNICQSGLVDGISTGICANTMQKLTIGGNVDDRDASTLAIDGNNANKKSEFEVGASATYYRGGGQTGIACAIDYIAPTHSGNGCSPWVGGTEIELDFTEALFANKGDIALVSYNTKELLLPIDPTFTEIKPNMFANLPKLRHIIIPNNIVTIGDAAFYCNGGTYLTEEISIGNGVKTIGNSAFAASGETGRSLLTDIRFEPGISDVKILSSVFMGCKAIKHMMLPEGIVSLGESCFNQLLELESVHLPTTLEYIGINCFRQTGLTMLTIPASVKVIDYNAFSLCRITDIFLMAENLNQLPYIYAEKYGQLSGGDGTSSTFDSHMLFGNNTTADNSQHDAFAEKDSQGAEELFRLSVNGGNTISKLHFHENLKDFIDMNPWYFEGQTTPKPSSDALGGNGGINEEKHLSDTYYLVDKENQTYPCLNAGDLNRAAYSAYFNSENHQWGAATDYTTDAGTQVAYYNPDTGVLSDVTEDANHIYKVLRKEGWRQFTFKAGDAGSEEITFHKQYDNVWYTMCFPFSLTDEQLESAFNAEYNIADFSGVEIVTDENKPENKSLVIHFSKIAKAKYYDQDHNEYQRVEGSKVVKIAPNGAKFNTYTYTRDGKTYTYTATFSNKSYKTEGDDEIYYIDGYLAQAGRPYMIHPNLGTSEGQPSTMTHMVGINYYSRDAQVIDQLCKDLARSVDLGTGKGYEGVTYSNVDLSDIAVNTDKELTENIDQKTYSGYGGQTYTFIGNCNEYDADVDPMPSYENGGLQPEPSYPEGVKPTDTIENPNPELKDPAENYEAGLLALYDAPVTYYNKNGSWERKTSTYGEIIEYKNLFVAYSDNGKNYYTQANGGDDPLDFSAMQNYFGRTDYFTDEEYNLLKNMCTDVAAWNVGSSTPEYQAYLNNKAAWDAYNAAKNAYLAENPGATEDDFDNYVSGKVSDYNGEVQRVREANAAAIANWRASLADHEVLIPTNAYFLSRKSTEYYTHFFREIAPMSGREAGHGRWTRYSAVLVPNATALAGIEAGVEPGQASGAKAVEMLFDEAYSNFYDATAIEEIVEEAKEKGQKVEYMDVVVSIDGKVVRRGNTSLEGLPSGLYIVNGKKYFVK